MHTCVDVRPVSRDPKGFKKKTPRIFNNRAGHWIRSTHTHPTPCYCSRQPRTWPPSVSRDLRISLRRAYVREKKRTRAQQSASCSVARSSSKQWIAKPIDTGRHTSARTGGRKPPAGHGEIRVFSPKVTGDSRARRAGLAWPVATAGQPVRSLL
jgi:hypothetical protein